MNAVVLGKLGRLRVDFDQVRNFQVICMLKLDYMRNLCTIFICIWSVKEFFSTISFTEILML